VESVAISGFAAMTAASLPTMTGQIVMQGDARKLEQLGFEPESVDCIVTSPPYFNLKRYNTEDSDEVGQNQTLAEFFEDLESIFATCWNVAKQTGVLWMVVDSLRLPDAEGQTEAGGLRELEPLPFRLADHARKVGWRLQEVVIWEKNKTLPYSGQGKLRNLIEYVLLLTKSQDFKYRPFRLAERHGAGAEWLSGWPERYHPLGRQPSNVWEIPIPTQGMWAHSERLHFCPLPEELVARCIELTTDKGDLVIDPFAGIGTVPAQAEAMGRRGRGVELNPSFIEIFEQRILPAFQAAWESQAETRRMSREDRLREAETIMMLRSLKAGKELDKLLGRWANERPMGAPAASVESVVVEPPKGFSRYLDLEGGRVERPPVKIVVLADASSEEAAALASDLEAEMEKPPFSTFGLDLAIEVSSRKEFIEASAGDGLYEFEQSRRETETLPVSLDLPARLPRLLSTVALDHKVEGARESPLDSFRKEAEKRFLEVEFERERDIPQLAAKLRLPQAEIRKLLKEHGIDNSQETFGIPFVPR
jgi:DNA modification methylase